MKILNVEWVHSWYDETFFFSLNKLNKTENFIKTKSIEKK